MLCDNVSIIDCREFDILLDAVGNHDHMQQNTEFKMWLLNQEIVSNFSKLIVFKNFDEISGEYKD